jgi:hypothetical protein
LSSPVTAFCVFPGYLELQDGDYFAGYYFSPYFFSDTSARGLENVGVQDQVHGGVYLYAVQRIQGITDRNGCGSTFSVAKNKAQRLIQGSFLLSF